jgi:hypothetical protein
MTAAKICCTLAIALLVPPSVHAQSRTNRPPLPTPLTAITPRTSGNDSLKNGSVFGAIVGAATAFAFGKSLCHAIREEGDPSCLRPALVLTAPGAAGGAAAGAGIDALLDGGRPVVRFTVRF